MIKFNGAQLENTTGLEEAIDNSPIGVAIVAQEIEEGELKWKRVYANKALAEMFGYSSKEALLNGSVKNSWVNEAQLIEFESLLTSSIQATNFEACRLRNDGTECWVLLNSHPVTFQGQNCSMVSLSFMAAVSGSSAMKGFMVGVLGMLFALVGSTLSGNGPRLTMGITELGNGLPISSAILGVLIVGEVFIGIEDAARDRMKKIQVTAMAPLGDNSFGWAEKRKLLPRIGISALIGTVIGALPGIGTTLAATLGYDTAKRFSKTPEKFGTGIPEGVAATEAANSAVSGANLIPVMSLGIPGNFAAVFIILAVESVGDFTLGPQVFRFTEIKVIEDYGTIINKDLVVAFAMFSLMVLANIFNWTVGGMFLRSLGVLVRVLKSIMLPIVLLITLTAVYAQDGGFIAIWIVMFFGFIGYALKRLDISILPFVIGFLLSPRLEEYIRGGFSASGSDPWFLLKSPLALVFIAASLLILALANRQTAK